MKQLALAGGILCGAASIALAVVYSSGETDPFVSCRADHGIDVAQIGGAFELLDETGQLVRDTDLVSEPTLLYFGYTFCPDVCPMDNMRNAEAAYILEDRGQSLQTVFVSVDPARDTPDVLAYFTDNFHPNMMGLTGTPETIAEVTEDYHAFYQIQDPEEDGYYLIDHSTYSYLMMPGHGVVDIVQRTDPAFEVAERASCMMQAV
ncbi:MAG: SCO family protein [Pseudomonadota bacterium]